MLVAVGGRRSWTRCSLCLTPSSAFQSSSSFVLVSSFFCSYSVSNNHSNSANLKSRVRLKSVIMVCDQAMDLDLILRQVIPEPARLSSPQFHPMLEHSFSLSYYCHSLWSKQITNNSSLSASHPHLVTPAQPPTPPPARHISQRAPPQHPVSPTLSATRLLSPPPQPPRPPTAQPSTTFPPRHTLWRPACSPGAQPKMH